MPKLHRIIDSIQQHPNYLTHTVLDGGKCQLLILTKDCRWFMYDGKNWSKSLHANVAEDYCHNYYKAYRFTEMLSEL